MADRFGELHPARALIDQGSESSLVTESLAQRLRLPRAASSVSIYGVGGQLTGVARSRVSLRILHHSGEASLSVSALVLPQLSLYNSGSKTRKQTWSHVEGVELADPEFMANDPVELLLGAEVYADILESGLRRAHSQGPIAQQTRLGWILSGVIGNDTEETKASTYQCRINDDLSELVQQF